MQVPTTAMIRKLSDYEFQIHNVNQAGIKAFKNCQYERWRELRSIATELRSEARQLEARYDKLLAS